MEAARAAKDEILKARVPSEMAAKVDALAEGEGVTRSEIVRRAIDSFGPGCRNPIEHWVMWGGDKELGAALGEFVYHSHDPELMGSVKAYAAAGRYVRACEARATLLLGRGQGFEADWIMIQCLADITSFARRNEHVAELQRELEGRFSGSGVKIVADFLASRDAHRAEAA